MTRRWLHSAPFDLTLLVGPPLLAALAVLLLPPLRTTITPVWGWVIFVLCFDVAHVYASLYRTYFDPEEFARRRTWYTTLPFVCWVVGAGLYMWGAHVFWRVLAYGAVFHFVRQQYGFMRLYAHLQGRPSRFDNFLDAAVIYATMLYPLAFWHASGDRAFAWFIDGDFFALPEGLAFSVGLVYGALLAVFLVRQVMLAVRGQAVSVGKIGVVVSTAAAWFIGIVWLNSDFAFTITNVVAHGLPYFALVWLYGRRRWQVPDWRATLHRPSWMWAFAGLLLLLAYVEEALWDLFVWREHPEVFFGASETWAFDLSTSMLAIVVPLLMVPQVVHYISDAWLWKFDGSNGKLKEVLLGVSEESQ
jgi:hypothetical protein